MKKISFVFFNNHRDLLFVIGNFFSVINFRSRRETKKSRERNKFASKNFAGGANRLKKYVDDFLLRGKKVDFCQFLVNLINLIDFLKKTVKNKKIILQKNYHLNKRTQNG